MTKPRDTMREAWLTDGVKQLRPIFDRAGYTIPENVAVSVGWPGRASVTKTVGQCWKTIASADGRNQVFISPSIEDGARALDILAHELCHAIDDCEHGHKGPFVKMVRAIGLEGKPTETIAGTELAGKLAKIVERLGEYPQGRLNPGMGRPKQSTRLLKVECGGCGYLARITSKWIDEAGCPICPTCDLSMDVAS